MNKITNTERVGLRSMPSPAHSGERPRSHRRVARRRRLLLTGLRPRPPALSRSLPARNPRMAEARRDAQLRRVAGPLPRPSPPGSPAAQQLWLLAGLRAPAPARARSRLAGPRPHLVGLPGLCGDSGSPGCAPAHPCPARRPRGGGG